MCCAPAIPKTAARIAKDGDEAIFNQYDLTPELRDDLEKGGYYLIKLGATMIRVVPYEHPAAVEDRANKGKDLTIDFGGKIGVFVIKESV